MFGFIKKIGRKISDTVKRIGRGIGSGFNRLGRTKIFQRNVIHSLSELDAQEHIHIQVTKNTYESNREGSINGYIYQGGLSSPETAIYYSPDEHHLILGFRGTAGLQDVKTDYEIIHHREAETKRYQEALAIYDQLVSQFEPSVITTTGHSLGANIAMFVNANRAVQKVYAINPAFNLTNLAQSWASQSNVQILRTSNDSVSTLSVLGGYNIKTIPLDTDDIVKAHTMDNFIV